MVQRAQWLSKMLEQTIWTTQDVMVGYGRAGKKISGGNGAFLCPEDFSMRHDQCIGKCLDSISPFSTTKTVLVVFFRAPHSLQKTVCMESTYDVIGGSTMTKLGFSENKRHRLFPSSCR